MSRPGSLYERIGGRPALERVLRIFYDKVFAHPWLGRFFTGADQAHIERQQADFLSQGMGGPAVFTGTFPIPAHQHMFITADLWRLRCDLLEEAIGEGGIDRELSRQWMAIENSFERALVKERVEQCEKRHPGDRILAFEPPGPESTLS